VIATALAGGMAIAIAVAAQTPSRVIIRSDDEALSGAIALYLVDDGAIVTPDALEATHDVTIASRDGGYVVTCLGAETRGALVNAGTPALVELELRQRVASLVRGTPARAAAEGPGARISVDVVDKRAGDDARLAGRTARAFLDAGLSLAPLEHADERLCVDAGVTTVTIAWGPRCEGRPVGLARADLAPRVVVSEALRLRDAAPLAAPAPRAPPPVADLPERAAERPRRVDDERSSAPATPPAPVPAGAQAAPVAPAPDPGPGSTPAPAEAATPLSLRAYNPAQLTFSVGGLGRASAVDARASLRGFSPWFGSFGPIAAGDFNAGLEPLLIGEGFAGVGIAGRVRATEAVRLGAGLLAGAWTHGWYFADNDWGFALDPAAILPVWVDIRIVPGWHLAFAAELGALGRDRIHEIRGAPVWSRGGFSLALSVGLTVDIPGPPSSLEN
jgi:hypothetical protein